MLTEPFSSLRPVLVRVTLHCERRSLVLQLKNREKGTKERVSQEIVIKKNVRDLFFRIRAKHKLYKKKQKVFCLFTHFRSYLPMGDKLKL